MSSGVEVIGVRLWGGVLLANGDISPDIRRYAVYYKREGAMWRGLVDAVDELDAWGRFARQAVDDPYEVKVYYDPMKEQNDVIRFSKV